MTTTTACRCGLPLDPRGMCTRHCGVPPPIARYAVVNGARSPIRECPRSCVACRTRDSHCPVCNTRCATPGAARHHETRCREAENYLRKNPR